MITLITGPMMSGKSTELLRYLERAKLGKKKVCIIKPLIDNRDFFSHNKGTQTSYDKLEIETIYLPVDYRDFPMYFGVLQDIDYKFDVIGIDECQFFEYLRLLTQRFMKKEVYMSGLLATSEAVIFSSISETLPLCDNIIKLNSVCVECGSDIGNYTRYKAGKKDQAVVVGGSDMYDAVCSKCYFKK